MNIDLNLTDKNNPINCMVESDHANLKGSEGENCIKVPGEERQEKSSKRNFTSDNKQKKTSPQNSSKTSGKRSKSRTTTQKRVCTEKGTAVTQNRDSEDNSEEETSPGEMTMSSEDTTKAIMNLTKMVASLSKTVETLVQKENKETPNVNHQSHESVNLPVQETANSSENTPMHIDSAIPTHSRATFCSGLPAGESLPDRIKQKIWTNKFIDFYDILYPDSDSTFTLALTDYGTTPTLNFTPRRRRALSEREWSRAFDEFMAIYLQRYPEHLQELLTYGKFVKELMERGSNWNYYDRQFRKDREFSILPWNTIRIDLQITASFKQTNKPTNFFRSNDSKSEGNQHIPKGYCYAYHNTAKCSKPTCTYKHICFKCHRKHSASHQCRSESFRKDSGATPDAHKLPQTGYTSKRL